MKNHSESKSRKDERLNARSVSFDCFVRPEPEIKGVESPVEFHPETTRPLAEGLDNSKTRNYCKHTNILKGTPDNEESNWC